jgi:LysM repeat protein
MFFDDDYKLKKVDLGTKKIVKKEDFLKKIEESKKITEEKPKKDYYYGVIAKFVRKL